MTRISRRFGQLLALIGGAAMLFGGRAEAITLVEVQTVEGIIDQLTSAGTGLAFNGRVDGDLRSASGAHPDIHFGADDVTGYARWNNLLNTFALTFNYTGQLANGAGIGGSVSHTYEDVQTLVLGDRTYLLSYAPAANDGAIDASIWSTTQQNGLPNLNLDGVAGPNTFSSVPTALANHLQSTGQSIFFFLEIAPGGDIEAWFRTPSTFNLNVAGLTGAHTFEHLVLNGRINGGAQVPEPATAALLGLGLIGAVRRKRTAA